MLSPTTTSPSSSTTSCIPSPPFSAYNQAHDQAQAHQLHSPSASARESTASVEGQHHQQCRICGDTAGCGLNFGCLSCESCKAFFRRCHTKSSLLSGHQQQKQCCPFSGQCQITKASRKACPACRLEKCVKAGMRTDMVDAWKKHWNVGSRKELKKKQIKPEEQSALKRQQKHNGGGKRKRNGSNNSSSHGQSGEQHVCVCGGRPRVTTSDKGCQTDLSEDLVVNKEKPTALSPAEQSLLDELLRANAVMETPLRLPQLMLPPFNPMTLLDALRVSELAMRRLVAMFKQLTSFRTLDPRDQVTLLRGSLVQLLILRGAMAFDGHQAWRHAVLPSSSSNSNVAGGGAQPLPFCVNFNVLPAEEQHSAEHKRFLTTFGEQLRTNRPVMLILHAIVLFSTVPSSSESLVCKETVQSLRAQYCALLQQYLLLLGHGHDEAYSHLMAKLGELRQLNASFQWLYSRLDPGELEPLLKELFSSAAAAK